MSRRRSRSAGTILKRSKARRRKRNQQFSNIEALLADIAKRQQASMLKAPPHRADDALALAIVMQEMPLDVADHRPPHVEYRAREQAEHEKMGRLRAARLARDALLNDPGRRLWNGM